MTDDQKCMAPPLSEHQLYRIRIMADMRFDCDWWNMPNVKRALRDLLAYIDYLEKN